MRKGDTVAKFSSEGGTRRVVVEVIVARGKRDAACAESELEKNHCKEKKNTKAGQRRQGPLVQSEHVDGWVDVVCTQHEASGNDSKRR
jgi:hypothetical protein